MTDRDDDAHDEPSPDEDDTGTEDPGLAGKIKHTVVAVGEVVVDALLEAI
jgi:hypothetical protein